MQDQGRQPQQGAVQREQQALRCQNYRYQPRDAIVRQHYQEQDVRRAPAPYERGPQGTPQDRSTRQQQLQRSNPPALPQSRPAVPSSQPPQRGGESMNRPAPTQAPVQQRGPAVQDQNRQPQQGAVQREKPAPRSSAESAPPGKGTPQERGRAQGQEKDRAKAEERGQEPNK